MPVNFGLRLVIIEDFYGILDFGLKKNGVTPKNKLTQGLTTLIEFTQ